VYRASAQGGEVLHANDCGRQPDQLSRATKMETIKILLNGAVSTLGAKFCSADVSFYLNMPMEWHEFVCILFNLIPDEIISEYALCNLVNNKGFVLV
jgi:hypothetical protein